MDSWQTTLQAASRFNFPWHDAAKFTIWFGSKLSQSENCNFMVWSPYRRSRAFLSRQRRSPRSSCPIPVASVCRPAREECRGTPRLLCIRSLLCHITGMPRVTPAASLPCPPPLRISQLGCRTLRIPVGRILRNRTMKKNFTWHVVGSWTCRNATKEQAWILLDFRINQERLTRNVCCDVCCWIIVHGKLFSNGQKEKMLLIYWILYFLPFQW